MKKQNNKVPLLLIILLFSAVIATLSFKLYNKEVELNQSKNLSTNIKDVTTQEKTVSNSINEEIKVPTEEIQIPTEEIFKLISDENKVAEIPSEFKKLSNAEGTSYFNVAPDGGMTSLYIYTSEDVFNKDNTDQLNVYYIDNVGPSPCWAKELDGETCNEPPTHDFYGPFEGKLAQMLQ